MLTFYLFKKSRSREYRRYRIQENYIHTCQFGQCADVYKGSCEMNGFHVLLIILDYCPRMRRSHHVKIYVFLCFLFTSFTSRFSYKDWRSFRKKIGSKKTTQNSLPVQTATKTPGYKLKLKNSILHISRPWSRWLKKEYRRCETALCSYKYLTEFAQFDLSRLTAKLLSQNPIIHNKFFKFLIQAYEMVTCNWSNVWLFVVGMCNHEKSFM